MQEIILKSSESILMPRSRAFFDCLEDWAVVQGITLLIHLNKKCLDSLCTVSPGYMYDCDWLSSESKNLGISFYQIHDQVLVLKNRIEDTKWLWFPRIWGVEESASLMDGLAYIQRRLRFNLLLDLNTEITQKSLGVELFSEESASRSLNKICQHHGLVLCRISDLTYSLRSAT